MRRRFRWPPHPRGAASAGGVLALALACAASPAWSPAVPAGAAAPDARPASYASFVPVTAERSLAEAAAASPYVYLPPGTHTIDNPLVIDRDGPFFLHGAERARTKLAPRHPGKPLVVVRRASRVNLSNLKLDAAAIDGPTEVRALLAENTAPLVLELQDCVVDRGAVEVRGPGEIRLQATRFHPQGRVQTALLLDHPDARLTMVGGNVSSQGFPSHAPGPRNFHVWARRGRLRIFGTGVQGALGLADFRIDAASRHGPHVIAAVRSEGANGAGGGASAILYVPPSDEAVDVLVESTSGSWASLGRGSGRFVDYNAAGTLWLVGNNGSGNAGSLVVGSAPKATVVAIGNISLDPERMLPVKAARKIDAGNLYAHRYLKRSMAMPHVRQARPEHKLGAQGSFPAVPRIEIPPPLPRPRVERALPGMLDAKEFGAVGDGVHDDTDAIQAALDARCDGKTGKVLHLPAGTYRLTRTLHFNHRGGACRRHPTGGWIAGAGRERTVLARDPGGDGGVFATEGMAYFTVQGITFRTAPWRHRARPSEPAFALENGRGVGPASQEVSFYDVRFDGGRHALAIGIESRSNCSENLMVDAEFANAGTGLAVGTFNAVANMVYAGRFEDNENTMGHVDGKKTGGTWGVLGATVRGTRDRELVLRGSATGTWYLHGLDSDTPSLLRKGATAAGFPLVFENAKLAPRGGAGTLDFSATGGPIFLHSEVRGLALRLGGRLGANYAISLHSQVAPWQGARAGPHSFVDRLD